MTKRYSKRAIFELADVNTNDFPGSRFYAPEPVKEIGRARGTYGATARLYRGELSGKLYACGRFADVSTSYMPGLGDDLSDADCVTLCTLDHVEKLDAPEGCVRVRFVSVNGNHFDMAGEVHGMPWALVR